MNISEVREYVMDVITNHFHRSDVDESTRFINDLGGSSIDEMEFTLTCEENYHIDLYEDTNIKRIETVGQLIEMIWQKVKPKDEQVPSSVQGTV